MKALSNPNRKVNPIRKNIFSSYARLDILVYVL